MYAHTRLRPKILHPPPKSPPPPPRKHIKRQSKLKGDKITTGHFPGNFGVEVMNGKQKKSDSKSLKTKQTVKT